jgi:hypothetical protein
MGYNWCESCDKDYKEYCDKGLLTENEYLKDGNFELARRVTMLVDENERLKYALELQGDDTIAIISQKYFDAACKNLDESQAENERLKCENEYIKRFWYQHMEDEKKLHKFRIEQLKEALRKCSPFGLMSHPEAKCNFCGMDDEHHTDDCEYVRLIGGAE